MTKTAQTNAHEPPEALFGRIVSILEQTRGNVVRAEYGKKVIEELSVRLNERYGKGFSEENLQLFRRFYIAYSERITIPYPVGTELVPVGKSFPAGSEIAQGFSPQLSWSHYRVLMRVENTQARDFYRSRDGGVR